MRFAAQQITAIYIVVQLRTNNKLQLYAATILLTTLIEILRHELALHTVYTFKLFAILLFRYMTATATAKIIVVTDSSTTTLPDFALFNPLMFEPGDLVVASVGAFVGASVVGAAVGPLVGALVEVTVGASVVGAAVVGAEVEQLFCVT
jgi:hypothetical protein